MAEEDPFQPNALFQSAEQWLRESLDDRVLQALGQIDQERVRQFFAEWQRRFASSTVYDLGALKDTASQLLPLFQRFEETRPYAVWLRTRLDYLEAADQLRQQIKPTPPGRKKAARLPSPSPQLQRSIWTKQLEQRPVPPLAREYVPRLKPIFLDRRVPPELVWLAEVESSFNPQAKSPAGAVGMFQLMQPTAKSLGLSTWRPDERLDPEKSAGAAAKYLRRLHGHYGDWRLSLAAYNAGEGRVDSLLKKARTRSFDAIASRLPAETQMYVPKCEATLHKREGRSLADLRLPRAGRSNVDARQ
jgi:membrane-bound lytic murein transglycosylase D